MQSIREMVALMKHSNLLNETIEQIDKEVEEYNICYEYYDQHYREYRQELSSTIKNWVNSFSAGFIVGTRKSYLEDQLRLANESYQALKGYVEEVRGRHRKDYWVLEAKHQEELRKLATKIKTLKIQLAGLEYQGEKKIDYDKIERAGRANVSQFFDKKIKSGRNYKVNCIFHHEKTPSMLIFDDGHFHCFGCGKHGNAIHLYRELFKCDFETAVNDLCTLN